MRGFKKIVQYLPHEVVDFEIVLTLLAKQDIKEYSVIGPSFFILFIYIQGNYFSDLANKIHASPLALHSLHGAI